MQPSLRLMMLDDSQRIHDWRNRPNVARFMYADHRITPEEHAAWFARALQDPGRRYWIIALGGAPIGLVNLYDIDAQGRTCSWAFYIAEEVSRGSGIGSWVEFTVLTHVFEHMGFDALLCEVLEDNQVVLDLHAGFGFRPCETLANKKHADGRWFSAIRLRLDGAGWEAVKEAKRAKLAARFPDGLAGGLP